ncbi:MAG: NAD(P)(+) transhydrogenase (Re/Si-specific) subunit alpha, partial [Pirellulales bacterium]
AIPGKAAPILVTRDAVSKMRAGSVIVDLAAERGGNCEATVPGETVVVDGVTIMGPTNLVSDVPFHTSQLYARNISTYLLHLLKLGLPQIALDDEICRDTLVARGGQLVHNRVRAAAGLPPLESEPKPTAST